MYCIYILLLLQVILGHEFCGEVTAMGSGVSSVSIGDIVSINPNSTCGSCRFCTRGQPNYCKTGALRSTIGLFRPGGWAQFCEVSIPVCTSSQSTL